MAGLSVSSASLILNGVPNSGLSQAAIKRVEESAEKLGYRPNRLAKALKRSSSETIGFISDSVVTTRFASGLINGALKKASEADQVLLVLETMGSEVGLKSAVETALDHQVDAIIIAAMQARKIILPKVPPSTRVVLLNAISDNHKTSVLPDEKVGGETAVDILFNSGSRENIALIGRNSLNETDLYLSATVGRRISGIRNQMEKLGLEFVDEVFCEEWEPSVGYKETLKLLKKNPKINAIICMNDRLSIGAYRAIQERGLSIPEDITIVSFDRDNFGELLQPALTTIALPYEEMGEKALMLATTEPLTGEFLIPMPLFLGGSVRSLPNKK
jgi:LacI family transcriptional regulator